MKTKDIVHDVSELVINIQNGDMIFLNERLQPSNRFIVTEFLKVKLLACIAGDLDSIAFSLRESANEQKKRTGQSEKIERVAQGFIEYAIENGPPEIAQLFEAIFTEQETIQRRKKSVAGKMGTR